MGGNQNLKVRCCKVSLKVCYGDSWKSIAAENLFLPTASNKKVLEGTTLSHTLEKTGIVAEKKRYPFRECLPSVCFKNKKKSEGFNFIVATLNVVNPKFVEPESEVEVTNVRVKIASEQAPRGLAYRLG